MKISQVTDEQRKLLVRFREAVRDLDLKDTRDEYLLKWLVARNFHVGQAEQMLRKSMEWRKVYGTDHILESWKPPEVLLRYVTMTIFSVDKFGCPVWINPFGRCDIRGVFDSVSVKDYVKYNVYLQELCSREMDRLSQLRGEAITQETIIFDLEHLSWRQVTYRPAMEAAVETIKLCEAHSPESLRRVFVVNAPKFYTFVYGLLKPFLHQYTVSKLRIFDHNADQWKSALLEEIDADQLPVHYGGTLTDPDGDPTCRSKICMGGEVPKSYYLNKGKPQPREGMQFVQISHGCAHTLHFEIKSANSTLKWQFLSERGDIGFAISYTSDDEKIDVIPNHRVDCHVNIEEGWISCTTPANYTVVLDNSFSYVRSKRVWYSVVVEEPHREEISPE